MKPDYKKIKEIQEITEQCEKTYEILNNLVTEGIPYLIEIVYPNKDGKQEPNITEELLLLIQKLNRIDKLCKSNIANICYTIYED